jgi:hypothetical protein
MVLASVFYCMLYRWIVSLRFYQALRQQAQPNVCIIVRMELGKPPPEDGRLKEELDGFSFTALAVPDNWSRPSSAAGSPRCA